jgi:hypothetical protein
MLAYTIAEADRAGESDLAAELGGVLARWQSGHGVPRYRLSRWLHDRRQYELVAAEVTLDYLRAEYQRHLDCGWTPADLLIECQGPAGRVVCSPELVNQGGSEVAP